MRRLNLKIKKGLKCYSFEKHRLKQKVKWLSVNNVLKQIKMHSSQTDYSLNEFQDDIIFHSVNSRYDYKTIVYPSVHQWTNQDRF